MIDKQELTPSWAYHSKRHPKESYTDQPGKKPHEVINEYNIVINPSKHTLLYVKYVHSMVLIFVF